MEVMVVMEAGGAISAHALTGPFILGLVAASPRVVGEILNAVGITGRAAATVIKKLPSIKAELKGATL